MSLFDYPRVNFAGRLRLNPGTANNEDYAQPGGGQALLPSTFGPYAGAPLGLLRSAPVQVQTYGLGDEAFVKWIQQEQPFDTPDGRTVPVVPAEWNYYGDMGSRAVDVKIVGVQTGPGAVLDANDASVPLSAVIGADLDFSGSITDVNPEGSPPATQFFVAGLKLADASRSWITSNAQTCVTKGVGLWINFFRNAALTSDDGAGAYVQHVVRDAGVGLPGFEGAGGLVLRYYVYLPLLDNPETRHAAELMKLYAEKKINPKTLEIVGTIAPWHEGEPVSGPIGRLLISRSQDIPTGDLVNNGMGKGLALAPAVVQQRGNRLSADFVGTFPEQYQKADPQLRPLATNPKYDFGPVRLLAITGNTAVDLGGVDYCDVASGNARGWLFDLELSSEAQALLDQGATLSLASPEHGMVLSEVDFYVTTEQLAVYGEQHGSEECFVNQGSAEPIKVSVYHRGRQLSADECPPITVWQYRSVPIQEPGLAVPRPAPLAPGEPLTVPTELPGNYLFTFRVDGETNPPGDDFPPKDYGLFAYPPGTFVVTWAPQISVRILPNEDYSSYYVDPEAEEPRGNERLTFRFLYEQVLRTYALLYPAMDSLFSLKDPVAVARHAQSIIDTTQPTARNWLSPSFMPRTRDLSETRRTLLQAWCRRVLHEQQAARRC